MLSPRPIIIGESTFSASMLITITPAIDQQRPGHTELGQGQYHRGCHRQHEPDVGHEAQEEGQDAPHQREVHAQHEQQDGYASPCDEVDDGAQPDWSTTF